MDTLLLLFTRLRNFLFAHHETDGRLSIKNAFSFITKSFFLALLSCFAGNVFAVSSFSLHSVKILNSYPLDIDENNTLGNGEPEYLDGIRYQNTVAGRLYDPKDFYPACVQKNHTLKMEVVLKGPLNSGLPRSCAGLTLEAMIFFEKGSIKTFGIASATLTQRSNGLWGCVIETEERFQNVEKTSLKIHWSIVEENNVAFARTSQRVYVVAGPPQEPMSRPWATMLELAMVGNTMGTSRQDYLSSITNTVHYSSWRSDNNLFFYDKPGKVIYVTFFSHTKFINSDPQNQQFSLGHLLRSISGEDITQLDCRDFSNLTYLMARSLGVDKIIPYKVSMSDGMMISKVYASSGSLLPPASSYFNYHQVLIDLEGPLYPLYDASLRVHDQIGPIAGTFSKDQYFYQEIFLSCTPDRSKSFEQSVTNLSITRDVSPLPLIFTLNEVLPATVNISPEVSLYVNGNGFASNVAYSAFIAASDCRPFEGISVTEVKVVSPTQLKISMGIEANVPPGNYNIFIRENSSGREDLPSLSFTLSNSSQRLSVQNSSDGSSILEILALADETVQLEITDVLGRHVVDKSYSMQTGINRIELNFPYMRKGALYIIRLKGINRDFEQKKIIY